MAAIADCVLVACGNDGTNHLADATVDSPHPLADAPALDLATLPSGAFAYTQGTYIEAFEFTASTAVRVTQLGYFDSNLAGTAETFAPAVVGLYDMTSGTLLGSATVEPDDPATGIYRFHALATPIALDTSDTYAAVGVTGTDTTPRGSNYGGQIAPELTWVSFAGFGSNDLTETSALVLPDFFWNTTGDLGPDFIFESD